MLFVFFNRLSWQLTVDDVFTDRAWDTGDDGMQGTGTEFYSMFTDEMRALNAVFYPIKNG